MLAPIDKLNAGGNRIIQIVVTTSCNIFNCSNCTQLLPFRKDYLHMTLPCFRKAVESVRDWPGIVALFGGNPCSHPQFPELCKILAELIPEQSRRGLWSNDLMGHGQVVHGTFFPHGTFNLNVHTKAKAANTINEYLPGRLIESSLRTNAVHAGVLAHYADFGLSYNQWAERRESCDINQKWSGAIVEREGQPYAYFCEVAAALDGIRGENHGIRADWGWWRHQIDALGYQTQIKQCCDRGCGIPLKLKGHADLDRVYDVSPTMQPLANADMGEYARQVNFNADLELDSSVETTDYMKVRS